MMNIKFLTFFVSFILSISSYSQEDSSVYCKAYDFIKNNNKIKNEIIDCLYLSKIKYKLFNRPILYNVAPGLVPIPISEFEDDSLIVNKNQGISSAYNDFSYEISDFPEQYKICEDSDAQFTLYFSKFINHVLLCDIQSSNPDNEYAWINFSIRKVRLLFIFDEKFDIIDYSLHCLEYY